VTRNFEVISFSVTYKMRVCCCERWKPPTKAEVCYLLIEWCCQSLCSIWDKWMESEWGALTDLYWQGKAELLAKMHLPVSLFPPQIQGGLHWDRSPSSPMKVRLYRFHEGSLSCSLQVYLIWFQAEKLSGMCQYSVVIDPLVLPQLLIIMYLIYFHNSALWGLYLITCTICNLHKIPYIRNTFCV